MWVLPELGSLPEELAGRTQLRRPTENEDRSCTFETFYLFPEQRLAVIYSLNISVHSRNLNLGFVGTVEDGHIASHVSL